MLSSSTHVSCIFFLKKDTIFTAVQRHRNAVRLNDTMVSGMLYHRNSHVLLEYVFVCNFLSPSEVLFSPQVTFFFSDYVHAFARNTVQILFEGIMQTIYILIYSQ